MILSYLFDKIPEKHREDVAFGLAFGLVFGLVSGLVVDLAFGLVFGLVVGFVVGFVFGLVIGLVVGLVFGLVSGLAFGLAFGLIDIITSSFQHSILILIVILVISEFLYWLDKNKLDKDIGRWMFTLLKKGECLFETSIIVVNLYLVVKYLDDAVVFIGGQGETINMVLTIVGYGTFFVLIILGFLWFNSLKYKEK